MLTLDWPQNVPSDLPYPGYDLAHTTLDNSNWGEIMRSILSGCKQPAFWGSKSLSSPCST
jgi:hypothetical protein